MQRDDNTESTDAEILSEVNSRFMRLKQVSDQLLAVAPKPVNRYEGPLSPQQVVDGIQSALANSEDLLEEAELLFDHDRFARAAALAVLSLEECWKALTVGIYPFVVVKSNPESLRSFWRQRYRQHTYKSGATSAIDLLQSGFTLEELQSFQDDLGPQADSLKQAGFYSDYKEHNGTATAVLPSDQVGQDEAEAAIELAKTSLASAKDTSQGFIIINEQGLNTALGDEIAPIIQALAGTFPGIQSWLTILQSNSQSATDESGEDKL